MARQSLGRAFGWLWGAYAVSTMGTWLAFDAFSLVAILALHAGPAEVATLSAVGLAVGAVVAIPLGPWMEFRRSEAVMMSMDLIRFAALATIPAAFALGALSFAQLLVVSVIVAAADITFKAASGACVKSLVRPDGLLLANGWLESTTWTASVLGPPLGGLCIGVFGPVTTMLADAVSYLLSAAGLRMIGGREPAPPPASGTGPASPRSRLPGLRRAELLDGWRHILASSALRPLFFNVLIANGLVMATAPLLATFMLARLGFPPWEYGLAFAGPCLGGLAGSRLARPLAARFGQHRLMITTGALRTCWLIGLAFIRPGLPGLLLVMGVELGLITTCGVFNPLYVTYRLEHTPAERVARTLSAWAVSTKLAIAALTAIWGILAVATSLRTAIAIAGLLSLPAPLLLPRREPAPLPVAEPARSGV